MDRSRVAGVRGILFTDMVGSTRLRSALGDDRFDALRRHHDAILAANVAEHGGQVVRWTGDGIKAEFPSASTAVAAAIGVQRAVARYPLGADAVAPFQVRMGLSVGEVVDEDDDIHGLAVIEAARLEPIAEPGEILATELVMHLGQRRAEAAFEEVGLRSLKGLGEVLVLRVVDTAAGAGVRPLPRALLDDTRFPMVGRAGDLAPALARWEQVRAGTSGLVLVAGHPGIGKSRFLARVADHAHGEGALVLAGACDSDLAVPYQPFAAAFAEAPTDLLLAPAVADGTGPLGPLFPARRAGRFEDAGPSARFELYEAVVALVTRLAVDQPLVLVLEDVQWATESTVQLLRHLVAHTTSARLLVVASYRLDDIGPSHPLQDLLAEVHRSTSVSRVELGALDGPAVAELVAARVPEAHEASVAAFAERVHEESGGSAFFVCELLHHLSATGELEQRLALGRGAELPVPDSVRDVVGQRLGRLPAEAADLLATAAIVGSTFALDLLADLSDRRPEDVLVVLEELARVSLVQEVDAGRFTFAHAIVRTTLLERQSATRQALAHRRVAEAIEARSVSDHVELAHHWSLAGEEARSVLHVARAARRDLEALAYESAVDRYQAVLDHHRRATPPDLPATAHAWLGLALARRAMGQPDYLAAVEEAGQLGRRLRDVDLVVEAAVASIWPGNFFVTAGPTPGHLVELAEDALELVEADDPRRVRILTALATHLTFAPDRARRERILGDALALARRLGDPELVGNVLVAEFLGMWDPTTLERRAEITVELRRVARACGDNDLAFFAGFFTASGAVERGLLDEARRALEALAGPVAASQNFYFGFLVDRLSLALDLYTGRPDLQARIDDLAERYTGTHADTVGTWSLQSGSLALQRGELASLVPAMRAMVDASAFGDTWQAPFALALALAGDREGAEAVLVGLTERPLDFFWLTFHQIVAQAAVELDRQDLVASTRAALLPFRDQLGVTGAGTLCAGLVATSLGELAHSAGDHAQAVELLDEALGRAEVMGAPFEAAKAARLLASALLALGDPDGRAVALVDRASVLADRHDLIGERPHLTALAERLAASTP